ncbi:MAG: 16S rRNA (cytosine(1402)-N(4))-methyltransferase RsmH [Anaerolineales bacterium]
MSEFLGHQPVLYNEIIHALQPKAGGFYVDCTVGVGGHAWGILDASQPNGRLLGMDLDPQALVLARKRLSSFGKRVILIQESYQTLSIQLSQLGWDLVDGILLDLGVSSLQLDNPERGFSFRLEGPLDMRFDPNNPVRAVDLVNDLKEEDLAKILYEYGEEHRSRKIARAICKARPIKSTDELAKITVKEIGIAHGRIHPATRTFQALRIAVNQELAVLQSVLPQAVDSLKTGGRLAVISFHSLEDRVVKKFLRRESRDCVCPPELPVCNCDHKAILKEINRRPIKPSDSEIELNPRSRSARLRVAEKI